MQTLILIHAENVGLETADTEPDPDATPLPPPEDPPTYNVTPTTIDLALLEVGATRERLLRGLLSLLPLMPEMSKLVWRAAALSLHRWPLNRSTLVRLRQGRPRWPSAS